MLQREMEIIATWTCTSANGVLTEPRWGNGVLGLKKAERQPTYSRGLANSKSVYPKAPINDLCTDRNMLPM